MHKYLKNQMVKEALLSKRGNLETESKWLASLST